jgi:hypothetical protein
VCNENSNALQVTTAPAWLVTHLPQALLPVRHLHAPKQRQSACYFIILSFLSIVSGSAGDVVVYEQPLLHVPQLKPSNPLYRPLQVGGRNESCKEL